MGGLTIQGCKTLPVRKLIFSSMKIVKTIQGLALARGAVFHRGVEQKRQALHRFGAILDLDA